MRLHDADPIFSLSGGPLDRSGRSLHPIVAGTLERLLALPELGARYRCRS